MAKKILVDDVTPLVEEYKGNVSAIARRLGVARGTVYNRVEESSTLRQALHDARQTMVDNAESALYRAVMDGNMTAIIFFLKTQGKDRGYTERHEQEVSIKLERELESIFDKLQEVLNPDDYHRALSAVAGGADSEA